MTRRQIKARIAQLTHERELYARRLRDYDLVIAELEKLHQAQRSWWAFWRKRKTPHEAG